MAVNRLALVDFGLPAAEREHDLERMFVELDLYQRVRSGRTTVILGNRGAGKSAILKMLARATRSSSGQVIELSPEDYSYEILRSTSESDLGGDYARQGAYAAAWKYMLYVEIMKKICERDGKADAKADAGIRRYIRDNHHHGDLGKFADFMAYLKRLQSIKVGPYEASVKSRELQKLYRLEEINFLLPDIARACQARSVYVLIDELDKGWDASEDAKNFIVGLFNAALSINKVSSGLRVYISLRQELYDTIPALYEDAQKFRDLIERITWNRSELLAMIARRIRKSVSKFEGLSDEQTWARIFDNRMSDDLRSVDYMLDRTQLRPRELIQYCAEVVQYARRAGMTAPVSGEAIEHVEDIYSHARMQDLAAEYRFHYAALESVFEAFRGLTSTLDREDLEYVLLRIVDGEVAVRPEAKAWIDAQDEQALLYALWNVGFLQARVPMARSPRGYQFMSAHENPHLILANVAEFRIHPAFHCHLGVAEEARELL